jgi:hypothetical protein
MSVGTGNWETEYYNYVLEITVFWEYIKGNQTFICIGFSSGPSFAVQDCFDYGIGCQDARFLFFFCPLADP